MKRHFSKPSFSAIAVLIYISTFDCHAQCTPAPWGTLGGGATAVAPCGSSRAIVGMGTRVDLVTTPTTGVPQVVASSELGEPVKKIMGIGSTAWVSTPTSIVCFGRLTSATTPLSRESIVQPTGGVKGFTLIFPYVYTWTDNFVTVYDFTTANAPSQVATFTLPANPLDVTFSNDRLYFGAPAGITVVSITNRAAPSIIRTLPGTTCGLPMTASVLGATGARLMYRDAMDADFRVCDVASDAAAPVQRGRFDIAPGLGIPQNFAGNMLVCEYGLIEINTSNPDAPTDAVRYTDFTSENLGGASITSGGVTRYLLAGQWTGMSTVTGSPLIMHTTHRSPPSHAIRLATSSPLPTTADLFVADGYANRLHTARFVTGAATPLTTLGGVDLGPAGFPNGSFDIAKEGNFAYVTMGYGGLQSWNVTNAFSPTFRGTYLPSGDAIYNVAASGTTVACVRFSHILNDYAIDLVDCSGNTPIFRDSRPLPSSVQFGLPRRVAMHNGMIYVLFSDRVARFSFTPTLLQTRSTRIFGTSLNDIVFAPNDIAYAVDSNFGIYVLGTESVNELHVFRGVRKSEGTIPHGIAIAHPWVVTAGNRLDYYRIDNPMIPVRVAHAELACNAFDIVSAGLPGAPHFILASGTCGLTGIDVPPDFQPVILRAPQPVSTCPGGTAVYTVEVLTSGNIANPVTFQWQRYVNNQAQNIPGATQQTLTLTNVTAEDAAWGYRCVVSNVCGNSRSSAGALDLCIADFDDGSGSGNCDGGVTIDDLLHYLSLFDMGSPRADVDDGTATGVPDGGVTIDDCCTFSRDSTRGADLERADPTHQNALNGPCVEESSD